MKVPMCRIHRVGEITSWAKTFLTSLEDEHILEITHEPNVAKFCETTFPPSQIPIVFVENSMDSRKLLAKLRSSGKPMYVVWYGKVFSKEDWAAAVEHRVHTVFENARPDEKKLLEGIRKLAYTVEVAEQSEQLLHSLKALLLQGEEDEAMKPFIAEFKTAVAKLERTAVQNEFVGPAAETGEGDQKLPFYKTQELGDALNTVHDLERTGVLWIKGDLPNEEGKVEFLQGKIIASSTGEVRGLKAIFRMFLWDEPRFLFTRKDPQDCVLEEQLNVSMKYISAEGESLRRRFRAIRQELPPPDLSLELEPSSLHIGARMPSHEFSTLASVIELGKVSQVIDYNPLPDVTLYEALIHLKRNNVIRVAT